MYDDIINKLELSKFRSSFKLNNNYKKYINDKGIDVIKNHAYDFVNKRLVYKADNDGKQTPYKGHPVFIAQHATATCCRGCIYKWYKIPENKKLDDDEVEFIVNIIMIWIKKQMQK